MRQNLTVFIHPNTNLPTAKVPSAMMWDLVEHLSYQRLAVSYEYRATHFTVAFLRINQETAQGVLDAWAKQTQPEAETAT